MGDEVQGSCLVALGGPHACYCEEAFDALLRSTPLDGRSGAGCRSFRLVPDILPAQEAYNFPEVRPHRCTILSVEGACGDGGSHRFAVAGLENVIRANTQCYSSWRNEAGQGGG